MFIQFICNLSLLADQQHDATLAGFTSRLYAARRMLLIYKFARSMVDGRLQYIAAILLVGQFSLRPEKKSCKYADLDEGFLLVPFAL